MALWRSSVHIRVIGRSRALCSCKKNWLEEAVDSSEFKQKQEGILISREVIYCLVHECEKEQEFQLGRRVLWLMMDNGFDSFAVLVNPLLRLFSSCRLLFEAYHALTRVLKPDQYTWDAIIDANAKLGEDIALDFYSTMQVQGRKPSKFTFASILKVCGSLNAIEHGRRIHVLVAESNFENDVVVGSTLLDMYAKCGSLNEAQEVFDRLQNRNVVTWSAMIAGYVHHGEDSLALGCFHEMQQKGIKPDSITFLCILKACGNMGVIDLARHIHLQIITNELQSDFTVGSSLLDMYANCGSLAEACNVFSKLTIQDVVSWGAMIAGYAQVGEAGLAMQCFQEMQCCGFAPNDIVFTSILSAFARGGFVEEALFCFKTMTQYHGITHNLRHITCLVDLLGHAGSFKEAQLLLKYTQPHVYSWMALLNACRIYYNIELGGRCFEEIVRLDSLCTAAYVLMSNVYASMDIRGAVYAANLLRKYGVKLAERPIEVNNQMQELLNMQMPSIYSEYIPAAREGTENSLCACCNEDMELLQGHPEGSQSM